MPIFDLRCLNCQHEFEQLVRQGDLINCPKCDLNQIERLLSPSGFRLYGDGYYKSDKKGE